MISLPLRIAVLECGTPPPKVKAEYRGYGGLFNYLLGAGADALSHPGLTSSSGLKVSAYDVVKAQTYPALDDIDAILMTGSKYNAFDNDPWILKLVEYTKEVLDQRRVRIIGVCFGHQIVGRAMGVKVGRSEKGWETSVLAMDLTKRGQEVFGVTSLVSTVHMWFGKDGANWNRRYTKCIEISFMSIRKEWSRWDIRISVLCTRCMFRRG